ncbi:MAG: hypothetical protein HPY69_08230 [Armatimonadetes bacterium]|nr:hypothetical protein [Armatimonadota bacterium]
MLRPSRSTQYVTAARTVLVVACLLTLLTTPGVLAQEQHEGLLAWYPADEGTGEVLHDAIGGYHGRILGARWVREGEAVALDFNGLNSYVDCGDAEPLRLKDGPLTIALWVRINTDRQQYLITRYGWSLYLAAGGVPHFEARSEDNASWQTLAGDRALQLDHWHHVAGVYDKAAGEWRLLLDGQRIAAAPRHEGFGGLYRSKLAFGSWAWTQTQFLDGLLGDLRLYGRALADEEIAALYKAGETHYIRGLRSPPRLLSLWLRPMPTVGKLVVDLAFRNLAEAVPEPGALVELAPAEGPPVHTARVARLDHEGRGWVELPTGDLRPGQYTVRARLTSPDEPLPDVADAAAVWTKSGGKPWWLAPTPGPTEVVPRPWPPLAVSDSGDTRTVACWNRRYLFRGAPFPVAVESAGAALLARPIRLRLRTDRGTGVWVAGGLRVKEQSPSHVVLETQARGAGLALTGRTTVEYDGMVRVDWRITPQEARELQELVCEIPLRADIARYWYYYPDRSRSWEDHRPGSLPADAVRIPFNPTIWLGDETRGLQWFTEHDADWLPADREGAVTVTRDGDAVLLKLHLIGRPVALDPASAATSPGGQAAVGSLAYTFGFQATPVKPVTRDAWDLRSSTLYTSVYSVAEPGPDGTCGLDRIAAAGVKTLSLMDWTNILCYNQPTEPDKLRHFVQECHKRGIQVLVYFGFQISDAAPEFAEWMDQVANWYEPRRYSYDSGLDNYPPKPTQTVYRVCYQSAWADFVVAGAARCMDEFGVDGVYLDGTGCPLPCYNPYHGCGPVAGDGTAHPRTTFFATRRMMQRLYAEIMSRNPNGQINLHNSSFMTMPSMAFATSCWDGEQLSTTPDRPMPERMPLDYFRTEFMGHQWGVAQEFLDYVLPYPFATEWGLTLLHDVPIRPYMYEEQYDLTSRLWRLMDEFGRRQAQWLPYWSNTDAVSVEPRGAYASLYRHPRNGVLVVVMNYTTQAAAVRASLQTARLGLPADAQARDGLTGELWPIQEGRLELPLEPLGWKAIWVR